MHRHLPVSQQHKCVIPPIISLGLSLRVSLNVEGRLVTSEYIWTDHFAYQSCQNETRSRSAAARLLRTQRSMMNKPISVILFIGSLIALVVSILFNVTGLPTWSRSAPTNNLNTSHLPTRTTTEPNMTTTASTLAHLRTLTLPSPIFNRALITQIHRTWFTDLPLSAGAPREVDKGRWFGLNVAASQQREFDASLRSAFLPALKALGPESYPLPPAQSTEIERGNAAAITAPLRRLSVLNEGSKDERAEAGLGLVILLDQFSRNVFRGVEEQGLVYGHYDRLALAFTHCILGMGGVQEAQQEGTGMADVTGLDASVEWIRERAARRVWFYMPLMHSEGLGDHDLMRQFSRRFRDEARGRVDEGSAGFWQHEMGFEERHRVIVEKFGRYPHRNEGLGRMSTEAETRYLDEGGERFSG